MIKDNLGLIILAILQIIHNLVDYYREKRLRKVQQELEELRKDSNNLN